MRTFIAIDLDGPLKDKLKALVRELAPLAPNIRWVQTPGMHLTLKFLGEIPDDTAAAVDKALRTIAAGSPRFILRLKGLGTFPPGRSQPRVLWIGVEAGPPLAAIQKDIESAAAGLGFEPEPREFRPHLTLGRVKYPGRLERLLQEMEKFRGQDFGEMEVVRLTFFRSVLTPGGAEYSVLGEFSLK
jgi:RNA 2',3'-cyclic 3'-phosphodiesterase